MPNMICARNYTLATTSGHTVRFTANTPTFVPDVCVPDALKVNIIFAERDASSVLNDKADAEAGKHLAKFTLTGDYRMCAILAVMDEVVKRNDSSEFTGGGRPKVGVLRQELNLPSLSEGEVSKMWDVYRDNVNTGNELPTVPFLTELLAAQRITAMVDAELYAHRFGADIRGMGLADARPAIMAAIINNDGAVVPNDVDLDQLTED